MQPSIFCSSGDKPNAPDARFCDNCTALILQSPQAQVAVPTPAKKSGNAFSTAILVVIGLLMLWFINWSYKNDFGAMRQTIDSFMGWKSTPAQIAPPSSRASTPSKPLRSLSLEKYNRINTGMKREEVEKLLGFTGTQTYGSRDRTGSLNIYTWREGEGASLCMVEITFINDKVQSKSQFGLG